MSGFTHGSFPRTGLFPAAESINQNVKIDTGVKNNEDWLKNKSFTHDTAQKLEEFQKELKWLQQEESDIPETSAIIKPVVQVQEVPKATAEDSKSYTHVSEIQEPDIPGQDYKRDKLGKKKKRRHKYSSGDSDSEKERYDRKRYNSGDSDSGSKDGRTYHKERKKKKKTKDYYSSENEDKKSKKSSKHKKKHKHKLSERYLRSPPKEKTIPGLLQTKHIFLNDVYDIAPDHPFKLDRAPDKNSLTYGSLYTGHVAEYRTTCNQCVGSLGKVPIFVHEKVKKKDKSAGNRYYDRENRKLGNQYPKERIVMNLGDSNNVETMPEFVAFGKDPTIGAIGVKVGDIQNVRDTILDPATSLYVQGMGGKSEINNKDDIIVELDETRVKVGEYNRKLRENPGSIKLWLEFAKFQDSISAEANLKKESVNEKKMTEKAVLEKKISIIEKALGHNPGHIDLLLAKIELSAEIVDSSKINKDLEQLLFVHPANTKLWKYHLMFNQSRLTVFTVAKQCKLYHKCLKMLLRIHTGVLQTHSVPENLEHEIIEIFLQYCQFLIQVGFNERALATFQAILEYNLFCPPLLKNASKENKMANFEEFWDNESAKIGTQGACGWNQTGSEAGSDVLSNDQDALEEQEEAIIERKESKHFTWLKIELLRDHHHWLPWKPDLSKGQTEEDCEDPERMVVYDDVKPVVFDISEMLHYDLVVALLEMLGHEPMGCPKSKFSDAFVSLSDKLNAHDDHSNFSGAVFELQSTCDLSQNPVLKPFVINILKQVIPCFNGSENTSLTLMLLEVQLSCYKMNNLSKSDKKEIRKIVKNLLKDEKNRNNLAVWCRYIEIERIIGKPGEAKVIAETAMAMYSGKNIEETTPESNGLIDLYSLYCDILMDINHGRSCELLCKKTGASLDVKKSVLATLACLMDEKKFDPKATGEIPSSSVLKTVSKFSKALERANANFFRSPTQDNKNRLLSTVWCYAKFTYCKSGLELSVDMISDVIQNLYLLTDPSVTRGLHEYKLKLIVHHMAVSSGLVSYLRDHLDQALQAFPNDPIFLSLFVDIERKSKISGRLNRFFDRACRMAESHIPVAVGVGFLCSVLQDRKSIDYSSTLSGLVHRARSWLEHSLSTTCLEHSILLWRLYLTLESEVEGGGRLKGVFYRAVQHCPWAKSVYLDGVRLLGEVQLQEIVDLMTEKEIRVHLPTEELDILISP
ncbi:nuclear exosome regulator NRDE2-like [Mya arenaria]|uniref:nuclear exosome regulator NRDE2-like n=1 Tax=Mya arenaria TaxID=6604 RepID=UPI0022E89ACC|nr:nuclear exosome regulator NRDE2-like [Mya arenaria]